MTRTSSFLLLLVALLVGSNLPPVWSQDPDEHAAHHPEGESPASRPAEGKPKEGGGGMMGGGMMGGGMGKMMERMGVPPERELYPELMRLPDLPPEERNTVRRKAHERMTGGVELMDQALARLEEASRTADYAQMQAATDLLREGVAEFESGLAARRALEEGKAPRKVALQWFRSQMNLEPQEPQAAGVLGMSWLHVSGMASLLLLSVLGIWTYVSRMRRAEAIVAALADQPSRSGGAVGTEEARPEEVRLTPTSVNTGSPVSAVRTASWAGALSVVGIFDETPDVKTFRLGLAGQRELPFTFLPGQFLTLKAQPGEKAIKRSYTIASSPGQSHYCEITVKRDPQGVMSQHLCDQVAVGDTLEVKAPAGKFTFTGQESDSVVLIAGGVGVTPLMSVLRWLCGTGWPGEIHLVYSCRSEEGIIYREELMRLQERHSNLSVDLTLTSASSSWAGLRGRIDANLLAKIPDLSKKRIHICGPPAFLASVPVLLEGLGVTPGQIKTEAFGPASLPKKTPTQTSGTSEQAGVARVTFQPGNKVGPLGPDATILDVAEDLGIEVDSSCRAGTCGQCRVRLVSGQVTMDCEDGLEPEEKAQGFVLACQARASADVTIEVEAGN